VVADSSHQEYKQRGDSFHREYKTKWWQTPLTKSINKGVTPFTGSINKVVADFFHQEYKPRPRVGSGLHDSTRMLLARSRGLNGKRIL
jgi:hypothetical protein